MIQFPISYKKEFNYSMGECNVFYHIYDAEKNHLFLHEFENEELVKEFIEKVNDMYKIYEEYKLINRKG